MLKFLSTKYTYEVSHIAISMHTSIGAVEISASCNLQLVEPLISTAGTTSVGMAKLYYKLQFSNRSLRITKKKNNLGEQYCIFLHSYWFDTLVMLKS